MPDKVLTGLALRRKFRAEEYDDFGLTIAPFALTKFIGSDESLVAEFKKVADCLEDGQVTFEQVRQYTVRVYYRILYGSPNGFIPWSIDGVSVLGAAELYAYMFNGKAGLRPIDRLTSKTSFRDPTTGTITLVNLSNCFEGASDAQINAIKSDLIKFEQKLHDGGTNIDDSFINMCKALVNAVTGTFSELKAEQPVTSLALAVNRLAVSCKLVQAAVAEASSNILNSILFSKRSNTVEFLDSTNWLTFVKANLGSFWARELAKTLVDDSLVVGDLGCRAIRRIRVIDSKGNIVSKDTVSYNWALKPSALKNVFQKESATYKKALLTLSKQRSDVDSRLDELSDYIKEAFQLDKLGIVAMSADERDMAFVILRTLTTEQAAKTEAIHAVYSSPTAAVETFTANRKRLEDALRVAHDIVFTNYEWTTGERWAGCRTFTTDLNGGRILLTRIERNITRSTEIRSVEFGGAGEAYSFCKVATAPEFVVLNTNPDAVATNDSDIYKKPLLGDSVIDPISGVLSLGTFDDIRTIADYRSVQMCVRVDEVTHQITIEYDKAGYTMLPPSQGSDVPSFGVSVDKRRQEIGKHFSVRAIESWASASVPDLLMFCTSEEIADTSAFAGWYQNRLEQLTGVVTLEPALVVLNPTSEPKEMSPLLMSMTKGEPAFNFLHKYIDATKVPSSMPKSLIDAKRKAWPAGAVVKSKYVVKAEMPKEYLSSFALTTLKERGTNYLESGTKFKKEPFFRIDYTAGAANFTLTVNIWSSSDASQLFPIRDITQKMQGGERYALFAYATISLNQRIDSNPTFAIGPDGVLDFATTVLPDLFVDSRLMDYVSGLEDKTFKSPNWIDSTARFAFTGASNLAYSLYAHQAGYSNFKINDLDIVHDEICLLNLGEFANWLASNYANDLRLTTLGCSSHKTVGDLLVAIAVCIENKGSLESAKGVLECMNYIAAQTASIPGFLVPYPVGLDCTFEQAGATRCGKMKYVLEGNPFMSAPDLIQSVSIGGLNEFLVGGVREELPLLLMQGLSDMMKDVLVVEKPVAVPDFDFAKSDIIVAALKKEADAVKAQKAGDEPATPEGDSTGAK